MPNRGCACTRLSGLNCVLLMTRNRSKPREPDPMSMTLYSCPETRSMRSLWLLNELGVPFDLVDMPFDHKFLRAKGYLAIHPLGRIPALKDEDMTLFESGAICEYLCEKYNSPLNR